MTTEETPVPNKPKSMRPADFKSKVDERKAAVALALARSMGAKK